MTTVNPNKVLRTHEIQIRVRYQETDAQGHVHHANYLNYFEMGRIEMLRASGHSYREFEKSGLMLVVTEMACQYYSAAQYDDLLNLKTSVVKAKGVRISHEYEITKEIENGAEESGYEDSELVVKGQSTIACVNRDGKVSRLPNWLRD